VVRAHPTVPKSTIYCIELWLPKGSRLGSSWGLQPMLLALLLVGLALMVIAIAIWPARTEQQRRLREALMHGLAGDDLAVELSRALVARTPSLSSRTKYWIRALDAARGSGQIQRHEIQETHCRDLS
jgi:hypothetical protein